MKSFLLVGCGFLLALTLPAQQRTVAPAVPPVKTSIERLEKDIPALMKEASVPGMAVAMVRSHKVAWTHYFGVTNTSTKAPVVESTVFEAASLTKVVAAYAALKLVDQGKLDLDVPLNKYLGNNYDVGDDKRLDAITARRVLSHTSGFPNWRSGKQLPINFKPGEKFSYSGEGFVYLSRTIEKITGKSFETLVQETVFDPLGMNSSSFVWRDDYVKLAVHRHDLFGNVSQRNEEKGSNAAASLRTTANDYTKFVIALMQGKGLKKKTWKEMMSPQINVNAKAPEVFWGLGVGLEISKQTRAFWHWGDQGDSKAWVLADLKNKNAVVFFANSANGLSFVKEVVDDALGGDHPSIEWLDYERFNSASRMILKSVLAKGATETLKDYHEKVKDNRIAVINEDQFNNMGYQLIYANRLDDAIAIFTQNTIDYPKSANTWDSLAEALAKKGDKEAAIKYYEKALELDPTRTGSEEALKKLR